jgi:hypothetical protein
MLLIAVPLPGAQRDRGFVSDESQRNAQKAHLDRLSVLGRFPEIRFENADKLSIEILRSSLHDFLAGARATKSAG